LAKAGEAYQLVSPALAKLKNLKNEEFFCSLFYSDYFTTTHWAN
jgi:hypothetical protein